MCSSASSSSSLTSSCCDVSDSDRGGGQEGKEAAVDPSLSFRTHNPRSHLVLPRRPPPGRRLPHKKRPLLLLEEEDEKEVLRSDLGVEGADTEADADSEAAVERRRPSKRCRKAEETDEALSLVVASAAATLSSSCRNDELPRRPEGRTRSSVPGPVLGRRAVRICEDANVVHGPRDNDDDDDGDRSDRWYQPSDYAEFRQAAGRQLSAWMSANSSAAPTTPTKGSRKPIPRGLEGLYHRVVLQTSKQRQMYASLIVWKHRVLVHRSLRRQQQRHEHELGVGEHNNDAEEEERNAFRGVEFEGQTCTEDVIRALSEPLTESDRIRAWRMASSATSSSLSLSMLPSGTTDAAPLAPPQLACLGGGRKVTVP